MIKIIEYLVHLYIYTTDLNSTSSLHNNLINAYLLYLASAMHSLGFVCYNFPTPHRRIADERIVLSTILLCTNAYPLSTHGSVQRIVTFDTEWLSTRRSLQRLVAFNASWPSTLRDLQRRVDFNASWPSAPNGLSSPLRPRQTTFINA